MIPTLILVFWKSRGWVRAMSAEQMPEGISDALWNYQHQIHAVQFAAQDHTRMLLCDPVCWVSPQQSSAHKLVQKDKYSRFSFRGKALNNVKPSAQTLWRSKIQMDAGNYSSFPHPFGLLYIEIERPVGQSTENCCGRKCCTEKNRQIMRTKVCFTYGD